MTELVGQILLVFAIFGASVIGVIFAFTIGIILGWLFDPFMNWLADNRPGDVFRMLTHRKETSE